MKAISMSIDTLTGHAHFKVKCEGAKLFTIECKHGNGSVIADDEGAAELTLKAHADSLKDRDLKMCAVNIRALDGDHKFLSMISGQIPVEIVDRFEEAQANAGE